MYGSVRHHLRIGRPADTIWELVGDPARLHEWFPGIDACSVDGDKRTIHTSTGMAMPEVIITNDPVLRRFQYRVDIGIVTYHRGTIDVLDLGDETSVVVYSTDADPRTMALTIGGATRGALVELQRIMEATPSEEKD